MAPINVSDLIAKILKEEGVEWWAGVHGGHVWQLLMSVSAQNIKLYHVRHEQCGAFMADGWGRVTRKPGVCFGTAGPGVSNMVTGVYMGYLAKSPMICLFGQHGTAEDAWTPFQEAYADKLFPSFTKWTRRMVDAGMVGYFMQKAFRDALSYPNGPVGIEIPTNILGAPAGDYPGNVRGYLPHGRSAFPAPPAGDPTMVEKAVRMLIDAKHPVVIGGDGIYWSDGSKELQEFIELINSPVHTRRAGRGAVPESHPLSFSGGYRGPILNQADIVCILGLRMSMLEHFGMPPTYPAQNVRYIQVSEDPEELTTRLPTEVSIYGSPKTVLQQMTQVAKEILKGKKPDRSEWISFIQNLKAKDAAETRAVVEKAKENKLVHPDYLAAEILNTMDKDATVILDSFSMAGFITDKFQANFASQMLDSATWGGVGQGVGIGMGAQLGRPGKQVIVLLGDGGLGIAGWDIETAARYNIPVCYILFNNSSWISNLGQQLIMPDVVARGDSWGISKDIRYDKIFAEMGCHTEYVTEPQQIAPALKRALTSGKASVINIIPDSTVIPPQLVGRIKYYQAQFAAKKS